MSYVGAIFVTACLLLVGCGGDDSSGVGGSSGTGGASGGSGGSSGTGGASGGSGGSSGECRFEKPSCSGCIGTSCKVEADACYGEGWAPSNLCSGTASAACKASSSSEALKKQTDYAKCVAANCTSACE